MSRPAFLFYPDDWMNDLGLRGCSPVARAIWMDMLCMMHQGIPYGHLADAAGPLPVKVVSTRCQVTPKELGRALFELEQHKVFGKTEQGVIFSRRMVRDEDLRIRRAAGGTKSVGHPSVPPMKDTNKVSLKGGATDGQRNGHRGPTHVNESVVVHEEVKKEEGSVFSASQVPSSGFGDWWGIWSKIRGTANRWQAERVYVQYVTADLEIACLECTRSYLASLRNPASGFNPENFLMQQSRDGFTARWPASRNAPPRSAVSQVFADVEDLPDVSH